MCSLAAGISGGLNLFQGLAMQGAAKDAAAQTAEQEKTGVKSAEDSKRNQQLALSERKAANENKEAQNIFAKNIETLQASRAIIASERAGTTIGLLLMDNERQGANYRESVAQSLESFRRQYDRNILATEAAFENRRNQLQSNINEAYNAIPSLGQTLLNIGTQGAGMYLSALP